MVHDQNVVSNTLIKNCVSGEVITLSYPIISSSVSSHNIADDFNWIAQKPTDRINCCAKTRYYMKEVPCTAYCEGDRVMVEFENPFDRQ